MSAGLVGQGKAETEEKEKLSDLQRAAEQRQQEGQTGGKREFIFNFSNHKRAEAKENERENLVHI